MKKIVFFVLIIFLIQPLSLYSMMIKQLCEHSQSRHKPRIQLIQRRTNYTYPYISTVYESVLNPRLSLKEKYHTVTGRLISDRDLSTQERNALILLQKIIPFYQEKKTQNTILHEIIEHNDKDLLNIAFHYNFEQHVNNYNDTNNTPLYLASVKGYKNLVHLLLVHNANVNLCNEYGNTPLIGAISTLHKDVSPELYISLIDIVLLLKNAGADPMITDDSKKSVFDHIQLAVNNIEQHRSRTLYNEDNELIDLYYHVEKILRE